MDSYPQHAHLTLHNPSRQSRFQQTFPEPEQLELFPWHRSRSPWQPQQLSQPSYPPPGATYPPPVPNR